MRNLLLTLALVSTVVVGCDKGSDGKSESSKSDDKAKTEDKAAPAKSAEPTKAEAKPAAEKPKLVDLDLSSRGKEWKGWTIQAPEGSTVMEDMSDLRVAGKPCPITDTCLRFDLILSQKKPDLKATKSLQTKGAEQMKDKIDFTQDAPDMLEWTRETSGIKTKDFEMVVKVGGKDISCHPLNAVGEDSDLQAMKDACKTVAKK